MAQVMDYAILIVFGVVPAIIWLLFYLRKDSHPESKRMVIKMFLYGLLAVIIAAIIEIVLIFVLAFVFPGYEIDWQNMKIIESEFSILFFLIEGFVIVAFIEELCKFLIVKLRLLNDPEFDEPVDAMLYMIIVALGFAALENIFYFHAIEDPLVAELAWFSAFRFLGANFLHALASGIVGYYLAQCIVKCKKHLILKGLIIAALLHGLFNISMSEFSRGLIEKNYLDSYLALGFAIILLSSAAFFVSHCFKKVKKIKSTCNI